MNTRALAAEILVQVVEEGKFLSLVLEASLPDVTRDNDRAFIQAICYGVLRWYWRLDRILGFLTRKPIKDPAVRMLALIGLFQLRYMRVKPHAAVGETVAAAGSKSWAKPLLNGVLRTYQREHEQLEARAETTEASATAHPEWLVNRLKQDWPGHYDGILRQNNEAPPLSLRVNRRKQSRQAVFDACLANGLAALMPECAEDAIVLETPTAVDRIPGFTTGEISVQDMAAQQSATLMNLAPGQRVLDLCAAPGGKTAHMLERCPEIASMVAVDIAPERVRRIRENLDRLGLDAELITADATRPDLWWDGRPFDRILVDAPCSATGVIRRHPDIKVLRKPADIAELQTLQRRIMASAWTLLAPGGQLLYATCSVLRAENEQAIAAFLATHGDARELPITADWGMAVLHGRQILTGKEGMDGFYYARLQKVPA